MKPDDARSAGGTDALPEQDTASRQERLYSAASYKRLEKGTFRIAVEPKLGLRHVEVDSGELTLMLEGLDLRNARRQKRWYRAPHERAVESTAAQAR